MVSVNKQRQVTLLGGYMRNFIILFCAVIGILILILCFNMGVETGRNQVKDKFFQENKSILQKFNAAEREEIWKQQKDLTDYAQKQKKSYGKTHNGY